MYQPVFQNKQKCQNCPIGPIFPLVLLNFVFANTCLWYHLCEVVFQWSYICRFELVQSCFRCSLPFCIDGLWYAVSHWLFLHVFKSYFYINYFIKFSLLIVSIEYHFSFTECVIVTLICFTTFPWKFHIPFTYNIYTFTQYSSEPSRGGYRRYIVPWPGTYRDPGEWKNARSVLCNQV